MNYPKVCVLMSTYNGEKYVKEQIESILNQKNVELTLLIRDDGSSDGKYDICKEYEKKEKNVKLYQGVNIGAGKSFMNLVHNATDADYYAFADQDDVWLSDKLEKSIEKIETELKGTKKPILYTSNQIMVDKNLKGSKMRFSEEPRHDLFGTICENKLYGCTMTFNKILKDEIAKLNVEDFEMVLDQRFHDTWCIVVANIVGTVVYDKEGRILYRQHENNVVGVNDNLHYSELVCNKLKKIFDKNKRNYRSNTSRAIVRCFPDIHDERIQLLSNCRKMNGKISLLKKYYLFKDVYKPYIFVIYVLLELL